MAERLGREALLEMGLATKTVTLPGYEETEVEIRQLSAAQAKEFMAQSMAAVDPNTREIREPGMLAGMKIWLVAQGLSEDGERMFQDSEMDQVRGLPAQFVDALAEEITAFSQLMRSPEEQLADAETALKN